MAGIKVLPTEYMRGEEEEEEEEREGDRAHFDYVCPYPGARLINYSL